MQMSGTVSGTSEFPGGLIRRAAFHLRSIPCGGLRPAVRKGIEVKIPYGRYISCLVVSAVAGTLLPQVA
ncbi:hypothetical protein AB0K02_31765, partial [Streptomyces sp. NPDC049597]|uniref:hypothetical protein n=1 Tax=Streptomyces sp. NPDC049597 TaxID=3155276 RepID=UPI0034181994